MLGKGIEEFDKISFNKNLYTTIVDNIKIFISKLTGDDLSSSIVKSLISTDSIEKFKKNKPSMIIPIIKLLHGVSELDTPINNNDVKRIINKFLKPQLWNNEIIYDKQLLEKDLKQYCKFGLDNEAKVEDYLFPGPGQCCAGKGIEKSIDIYLEYIQQYGYPCYVNLWKNCYKGKIFYTIERIQETVDALKLSETGFKLYLIALINHERTHSTQSYEFLKKHNVIPDINDERYQYQEHEYQADSASYKAILDYIEKHFHDFTEEEQNYLSDKLNKDSNYVR